MYHVYIIQSSRVFGRIQEVVADIKPSAFFNGFLFNFNLLSLDDTVAPPPYKVVAFNDILAVADAFICRAKVE